MLRVSFQSRFHGGIYFNKTSQDYSYTIAETLLDKRLVIGIEMLNNMENVVIF